MKNAEKSEKVKKSDHLNVIVDAELKERLRALAKKDHRNLSNYVEKLLLDHLKEVGDD